MITDISDIQSILAQSFFNGSTELAGLAIFAAVVAFVFLTLGRKSMMVPLIVMLPITLMFTTLGILTETFTILVIIIVVLGLAMVAKDKVD